MYFTCIATTTAPNMSITIYTTRTISITTTATTTATNMSITIYTARTISITTTATNMSMTNRTTTNTFFVMFSFRRKKFFICVTISVPTFSCSYFASFFIITFIFIYFNTIIIKTSSKCISTPLSFHIISKQKVLPYSLLLVYLFLCKIIFLLVCHLSNELYILVEYYFFQFFQKLE